jgi:hypothetical protein
MTSCTAWAGTASSLARSAAEYAPPGSSLLTPTAATSVSPMRARRLFSLGS